MSEVNTVAILPIATSPRDGTYVLIFGAGWRADDPLRCRVCRYDTIYGETRPWRTVGNDDFGSEPTHWMPLPSLDDKSQARDASPTDSDTVETAAIIGTAGVSQALSQLQQLLLGGVQEGNRAFVTTDMSPVLDVPEIDAQQQVTGLWTRHAAITFRLEGFHRGGA